MKKSILTLILIILVMDKVVLAGNVQLEWDDSIDRPYLTTYRIYYGTSSQSYGSSIDVGLVTSHIITNLSNGITYYFAATAISQGGLESEFSNEVSKMISDDGPLLPPPASIGGRLIPD